MELYNLILKRFIVFEKLFMNMNLKGLSNRTLSNLTHSYTILIQERTNVMAKSLQTIKCLNETL
jgi:hypothetical protein